MMFDIKTRPKNVKTVLRRFCLLVVAVHLVSDIHLPPNSGTVFSRNGVAPARRSHALGLSGCSAFSLSLLGSRGTRSSLKQLSRIQDPFSDAPCFKFDSIDPVYRPYPSIHFAVSLVLGDPSQHLIAVVTHAFTEDSSLLQTLT